MKLFKKLLSLFLIFALVFSQGLFYVPLVYAQEATESASVESSPEPSPPSLLPEPSPTPEILPSPEPTASPIPSTEPSPNPTPSQEPSSSPIPSATPSPIPNPLPSWTESAGGYITEILKLNTTYKFPPNEKVSLTFTKLPESSGIATVKEVNALGTTAYDITSTMQDGTFEYTLTLPTSTTENVEVKASEDGENFVTLGGVTAGDGILTVTGLDHFTVFVVVGTISGSTATDFSETSDAVVINEFLFNPSTGNDWVELYNKGITSRDLNDWVLDDNNPNTSTVMKTLNQIIPAGGFLAVDVSNRLNLTDDAIILKDNLGTTVSVVAYKDDTINGAQNVGTVDADESVARTTNGGSIWAKVSLPTKGYTNENSAVYVDDSNISGNEFGTAAHPFLTINKGIESVATGGTVNVAAGTYTELIIICPGGVSAMFCIDKSYNLVGDVGDLSAGPGPDAPVIDGGDESASAFVIGYGVSVSDVTIKGFEIRNFANPGCCTGGIGSGVVAWNSDASNIIVQDNYLHNLGWNGVLVGSDNDTIQSGWTVQNNVINNAAYAGVELTNVTNSTVSGNVITVSNGNWDAGDSGVGIEIAVRDHVSGATTGGTNVTVSGNTIMGGGTGARAGINLLARAYNVADADAHLNGVTVNDNTINGVMPRGIYAVAETRNADATAVVETLTITDNTINGNEDGLVIKDFVNGGGTPSHSGLVVNSNSITGNTTFGVNVENGNSVDAANNWWGASTGPTHASNTGGLGDEVSNNVGFDPWCTDNACTTFSGGASIVSADPALVDGGFTPQIGLTLIRGNSAYLGRTTTYTGFVIGLGDPENGGIETIKWKVTITGPSILTADMVDLDEVGFDDPGGDGTNIATFHYPFQEQFDENDEPTENLVATGSCDETVENAGHDDLCTTDVGFSLDANDVFTNADKIKFSLDAPNGTYTITYELVNTESGEVVLGTMSTVSIEVIDPANIISSDPSTIDSSFTPQIGLTLARENSAYLGRATTYTGPTIGLGNPENGEIETIKWKITIDGPSSLTADMVDLDEVGFNDPGGDPVNQVKTYHYPFTELEGENINLVATGSCDVAEEDLVPDLDIIHNNGCTADVGFSLDTDDIFTNADKIVFNSNAPIGAYTITYELINTNDGSVLGTRMVEVSVVDTTAPTVTTALGDGLTDLILSVGDANITFSEVLSENSKTAVENALTAGADKELTYAWDANQLLITASEETIFVNDVVVSVSDLAGNTATLKVVDSALDTATQTAPDDSGDATVDNTQSEVVITNPTQPVDVTISSDTTDAKIDVSAFINNAGTGDIPQITINSTAGSGNAAAATIEIPATKVTGPADWDGVIAAPTVNTVALPNPSGETRTLSTGIELGFATATLTFDKAVKILLPNQAGKRAGYVRPETDVFTEITNTCTSPDSQTAVDADFSARSIEDCKIDAANGLDLVIWTKHFTKFASYTQTTNSSSSSSTGLSAASAPTCGDVKPASAPTLLSAVAGTNSVTLTWSKAGNPVTYYLVNYSREAGKFEYGNPNVGGQEVTSYTVSGLSGGTTYYFKVRAGNGCAPGEYSNEISATPGGGLITTPAIGFSEGVLGASTTLEEDAEESEEAVEGESTEGLSTEVQSAEPESSGGFFGAVSRFFGAILGFFGNLFR